ncbi:MAG TPA: hypothetical protein VL404_00865 [Candidatus Eisenbacteria bacterium]|jgi:hypothetical protein|nr:hypothetical protein [Candidatus Eisenbacteria bacterium]
MAPETKGGSASRARIRRKIMSFFTENQGSIDTPRGVATWISEPLAAVRLALEDLVRTGSLKAHRTSSTVAYSCPSDVRPSARAPRRKK